MLNDTYDHRDIYMVNASDQTVQLISPPWITAVE